MYTFMKKTILIILAIIAISINRVYAKEYPLEMNINKSDSLFKKKKKGTRFLPASRRIDREINKIKFVNKGEFILGSTLSFGNITTDNSEMMLLVKNISAKGTIATIKPYVGYNYKDNQCVGIRFGYSKLDGIIDAASIDLGASNDMSFSIPSISYTSESYSYGTFFRSYAGLDKRGHFGLFAEIELLASNGNSTFSYEIDGISKTTNSENISVDLRFNPGVAVYVYPNFCTTLSFGFGGLNYSSVTQRDESGKIVGERKASKLLLKFNIAAINIGMTIHLWQNKK